MFIKLKILFSLCILLGNVSAVGEAGAIFLLISPGAGPQGTGEAQVAKVDDAYASYYNPAGFGFLKGREAAGMHVQWLPNLADDLFYEFIAYRHYIEGLGSIGGHIIFLNLGEQIGMDENNMPTSNWSSFMAAIAGSFGTHLSPSSAIGFNFKIFHQKLADFTTAGEAGQGYSTDFGFDIGYLKKFKQSSQGLKRKKEKKIKRFFNQFTEFYDQQIDINEKIYSLIENETNIYNIVEDQEFLIDEIEIQKDRLVPQDTYLELDEQIIAIISQMEVLIDSLSEFNIEAEETPAEELKVEVAEEATPAVEEAPSEEVVTEEPAEAAAEETPADEPEVEVAEETINESEKSEVQSDADDESADAEDSEEDSDEVTEESS